MKFKNKLKFKIRGRLLSYIFSSFLVIYVGTIGYINHQNKEELTKSVQQITKTISAQHANYIKGELDRVFHITRSLAEIGKASTELPWETFFEMYMSTQKNILLANKGLLGIATSWEYSYLNKSHDKKYGRYLSGYYYGNGIVNKIEDTLNMSGDNISGNYYYIKTSKEERLLDPSLYSFSGLDEDLVLNANFNTPIIINDEFVGLAGVDVDLGYLQSITDTIHPFKNSYSFIISNNGTWVTSNNIKQIGKNIAETHEGFCEAHNLIEQIQSGEAFSLINGNAEGQKMFYTFTPIISVGDPRPWSFVVAIPMDVVTEMPDRMGLYSLLIGIIGLIAIITTILIIAKNISKPIEQTTKFVQELSKGNIFYNHIHKHRTDEIGEMEQRLEQLKKYLTGTAKFAGELGKGNLDTSISKQSEQDILTQTLIDTQQSLKESAKEIALKRENELERLWVSDRISQLEEIARNKFSTKKEWGQTVLDFIVKKTDACQGAIYVLKDDEKAGACYEIISAIAYNHKRLINYKARLGEGLVGRCAHEKLKIYMTDIPKNYVHIESGLGEAPPTCLVLLPTIENNNALGVIEILSFKKIDDKQLSFLEKATTIIAATINTNLTNQKTNELLQQTQKQAEALAQQEEELRQNVKEMTITLEEATKTQTEMKNFIEAIDKVIMVAEYDTSRTCIRANNMFLKTLKIKPDQIIGTKQGSFASEEQNKKLFETLWYDLMHGLIHKITQEINIHGSIMTVDEIYVPAFNESGEVCKIYNICMNVTQKR